MTIQERNVKYKKKKKMERPVILIYEVNRVIAKTKGNKSAEPDKIILEILSARDKYGVDEFTEIKNEIYNSGEITEDQCMTNFYSCGKP